MESAQRHQAIVIIHGMGSQRPMRFLRTFVDTILPPDRGAKYYSEPDLGDDSLELRRMHIIGDAEVRRPGTFVYEYYWAHLMKGSSLKHVIPLARRFLLRSPTAIRGSLRFLWFALWLIIAVLAVRLARFVAEGGELPSGLGGLLGTFGWPQWVTIGLGVLGSVLYGLLVYSFGDVARYLDPSPDNVEVRRAVREGAVKLLRRLHDEGYDRIAVVGHSLGSFIALDAISLLWNDMFRTHHDTTARPDPEAALRAVERAGPEMSVDAEAVGAWQDLQRELWLERTWLGSPWRITDLLTFGSPLHHGEMLLGAQGLSLNAYQRLHEVPRCPPHREPGRPRPYSYLPREAGGDGAKAVPRLHNAAQFACTRWTNAWFPAHLGVFGDWFGGPLADVFGPGVRDVPITAGRWWRHLPVYPHGKYFLPPHQGSDRDLRPGAPATVLCDALELGSGEWLARAAPREKRVEELGLREPAPGGGDRAPA